jgi:hypothetical protein
VGEDVALGEEVAEGEEVEVGIAVAGSVAVAAAGGVAVGLVPDPELPPPQPAAMRTATAITPMRIPARFTIKAARHKRAAPHSMRMPRRKRPVA